jgi:hypothetical protein
LNSCGTGGFSLEKGSAPWSSFHIPHIQLYIKEKGQLANLLEVTGPFYNTLRKLTTEKKKCIISQFSQLSTLVVITGQNGQWKIQNQSY